MGGQEAVGIYWWDNHRLFVSGCKWRHLKTVRNKHNTPGIIKYPFRRMAAENPNAVYASINLDEDAPAHLGPRSILLSADIGAALQSL